MSSLERLGLDASASMLCQFDQGLNKRDIKCGHLTQYRCSSGAVKLSALSHRRTYQLSRIDAPYELVLLPHAPRLHASGGIRGGPIAGVVDPPECVRPPMDPRKAGEAMGAPTRL